MEPLPSGEPAVAGSTNGPVSVGVLTSTDLPAGVRNVVTTLSPVEVPKRFAVPTASWRVADDGETTVTAPGGEAALPPQPAIAMTAIAAPAARDVMDT